MKRKLLACIATLIIVFGTTLVPVGGFLLSQHDTAPTSVGFFGVQTAYAQASILTTTQAVTPPPDNQSGTFECEWSDVLCGLVKLVNLLLNSITNLLATVAGLILDFSIHYSISSSTYANNTVNSILVSGWKLIRDFSTIFLMFALFVVGFLLIFNAEGSDGSWAAHFSPGRTIARVLIVALLVNFSFLMCRAVIEVGNVFAQVLYAKVDQGNQSVQNYPSAGSVDTSTLFGKPSDVFKNLGISNIKSVSVGLLANINPQRVILDPSLVAANKTKASFGSGYSYSFYVAYLFVSFIAAILNLLMLFIFTSMAFLFLGRVIGLYLGIILSPFAFVSWTIPFLENMPYIGFDNWLKDVIGLTFLGPVYMLFVYLTVAFMKIPETIVTGSNPFMVAVFTTIDALLCVFVLLKGKKIAESMAGEFGKIVSGFAGKLAVAGVGLATGGTALLASGTLGAAGGVLARSGTLKRLEDAGPSQKQEDVQRRLQTASTFRKFGLNGIADSVAKGNFSTSGMLSNAARGVRGIGKSAVSTNPLDAKILGTSVRSATGKFATFADGGKKPLLGADGKPVLGADGKPIMVGSLLEQNLTKNAEQAAQKGIVMNRALDIAATRNAKNIITNNQIAAVTQGLGNPLASQPSTGQPAGSSGPVVVTSTNTGGPTGGLKQNFKLGGNTTVTNPGMKRQGYIGGTTNPVPTQPTNTTPPNNPPQQGSLPIRLAGNSPVTNTTSGVGVTMPRTMFNQNLKPVPVQVPTKSNGAIPSLTGDEEMDDVFRSQLAPKTTSGGASLTGDDKMDNALRATATSTPTTKSGSSATNFLSAIQGTAPAQYSEQAATKGTFGDGSAKAPEYTPVQQERILNKAIAAQQRSTQVQVAPAAEQKSEAFAQASTIAGTRSAAVQSVSANQSVLVEKNMGTVPITEKVPSYVPPVIIGSAQENKTMNQISGLVDVSGKPLRNSGEVDAPTLTGDADIDNALRGTAT